MSNTKLCLLSFLFVFCLVVALRLTLTSPPNINSLRFSGSDTIPRENNNLSSTNEIREAVFNAAIIVAGSRGYGNYRHQADMCHAFQVLRENGMSADNIITFIYDDLVHHPRNLYRGKLYNRPAGRNVYPGCVKDYSGDQVNKKVLFAVLRGDHKAVKGIGSGRVLMPNPKQRVFFAYSDHGMPGSLGFPYGEPLYADKFNEVIMEMKKKESFHQMLFYIESCYAGSMFKGLDIEKSDNILAVTAATDKESSYATFCPTSIFEWFLPLVVTPSKIGSCMGDLFTVNWLEDTEEYDIQTRIIKDQIENVKHKTSKSGTYYMGSHVSVYGDTKEKIVHEFLAEFMSQVHPSKKTSWTDYFVQNYNEPWESHVQQDADLLYLRFQASKKNNKQASTELEEVLEMRQKTDGVIISSLERLMELGYLSSNVSISQYAKELIPTNPSEPIVHDWDCLRGMAEVWEEQCGPLNSYSGQYSRTFANLCNSFVYPSSLKAVLRC